MNSSYNLSLVALSLIVATMASYTALDIAGRLANPVERGRQTRWLIGGALAFGLGIWAMHFIGMLAFELPIRIGFDSRITFVSLAVAVGVSYFALRVASATILSARRLGIAGVLMGFGISSMHYLGMAAMRMSPGIDFNLPRVGLSVLIAIVASIAALWIAHALRIEQGRNVTARRCGAAVVMGIAICGMHYTGMWAASIEPHAICLSANDVDTRWMALTLTVFTISLLSATLLLSMAERRFVRRTAEMSTSLSTLNRQLLRLATLDALTELPNRSTLSQRLARAIARSGRTGRPFAVLYMDLDGFKGINDSLGHAIGDGVLKAFALRLRHAVRRYGTIARIGGDEFVVMVEQLSAPQDAAAVAALILTRMEEDLLVDGVPLRITPSIGIAMHPRDGLTVDDLLRNADAAMYVAKQSGRNTYRVFEPEMMKTAMRVHSIQRGLQEALTFGRFTLEFQPKYDGAAARLVGCEALLRWTDPVLGVLTPLEFIPVAERSGHIIQIGYWVLAETCRTLVAWDKAGLAPTKVAINLSPVQLRERDLVERMRAIVDAHGIGPERIMFEITESVAMHDAEKTVAYIRGFHEQGFEIAIDDFGTGYSSLAYLQQFRVKQLKIDRFFTDGLDKHGEEAYAIVSAIIALAHSLKMDVVAEGVETATQLEKLNSLFCDQVQGFLLAKPLPPDTFADLLRAQTLAAPAQVG
ncbi:bifunctional diguanylate cyclase/phosphodiesterase [Pararobbsia silviterrae]|uniref:Bifunctional diguanylate cyclase/phosphodiesterase n=2 Tax=Pararobbsia silviterrae TaxID=1792498 RepID=A0A494Y7C2_9BURK|nr:EAL domain-containing protein [Pararobbsia silviterrae]RKP58544.1 bifunctional diguanylate cyclase/phosphodiesterase [Pararobbsia silviterrae]